MLTKCVLPQLGNFWEQYREKEMKRETTTNFNWEPSNPNIFSRLKAFSLKKLAYFADGTQKTQKPNEQEKKNELEARNSMYILCWRIHRATMVKPKVHEKKNHSKNLERMTWSSGTTQLHPPHKKWNVHKHFAHKCIWCWVARRIDSNECVWQEIYHDLSAEIPLLPLINWLWIWIVGMSFLPKQCNAN